VEPPDAKRRIEQVVSRGIDWPRLVRMADDHGVLPLLDRLVHQTCPDIVPPETRDLLRDFTRSSELRCRMLLLELFRLLDLFERQGVPVIPYKGPVLAAVAWGDTRLRQFRDLDILVHETDLPIVRALLEAHGYRLDLPTLTRTQQWLYHRANQYEFASAEGLIHIDLHWDVVPKGFPFSLASERLWLNLDPVSLPGRTVRSFAFGDSIQLLCVHGTKDGWSRLVWVCDVDRLIRSRREVDWQGLLEESRAWRCERMLLLGLRLAHDLLGTPLPSDVMRRTQALPSVDMLASKVFASLPEGKGPALSGFLECLGIKRLYFETCDRLVDGFFYACRTLVTPDTFDEARVKLPDWLFPLYYLLRPLNRISRCASVVWRRLFAARHTAAGCG
jgi:hypothetical protein